VDNHRIETPDLLDQLSLRELRQGLDEELQLLPERYRAPVVLCHLQGQTQEEAARALGWSKATVRRRLTRARKLLRARLLGRGLAPALGVSLLAASSPAPVSAALVEATMRGALAAGAVSPTVAALAEAYVRGLASAKLQIALAFVAIGAIALAGGMAAFRASDLPATPSSQAELLPRPPQPGPQGKEPLPDGAVAVLGTRNGRTTARVLSLAFTPDSKALLSSGWEGCIRLWDSETGRPLRKLSRESIYHVDGLSLAADGRTLATRTESKPGITWTADIWDLTSGKTVRSFKPGCYLGQVALSPDGKTLAHLTIPDGGPGIVLHDLTDTLGPRSLPAAARRSAEYFMQFSPDGRLLALGAWLDHYPTSGNKTPPPEGFPVQVWDTTTGKSVCVLAGTEGLSSCMAFTPDGKGLVTGGLDGAVRVWDLGTGRPRQTFRVPEGVVVSLALAADGKTVVAASRGKKSVVLAWDVTSGRENYRQPREVSQLALSPDGRRLAVVDEWAVVRLLDAHTGRPLEMPPGHTCPVHSLLFSPDGKEVASADWSGHIIRWDPAVARPAAEYNTGRSGNRWLGYSPDGALLTADTDPPDGLRVTEAATGKVRRRLTVNGFPEFQLSPDGSRAILSSKRGTVVAPPQPIRSRLWDLTTGKPWPAMKEMTADYPAYVFSPDGKHLASSVDLTIWDLDTGRPLPRPDRLLEGVPGRTMAYTRLALSPDGKLLAFRQQTATAWGIPFAGRLQQPGPLRLWDLTTAKEKHRLDLPREDSSLEVMAFSPDSRLLAASGSGAQPTVRIWDAASGKEVHRFTGHEGEVTNLAFSPDGRRLASGSMDTTILIWDIGDPAAPDGK
jgi:WD40 repeat protein